MVSWHPVQYPVLSILRTCHAPPISLIVKRHTVIVYCHSFAFGTRRLPALALARLSVDSSPSSANRPSYRHSRFTPSPICTFHHPCIAKIGLCFFVHYEFVFSRLRRVTLRTYVHTHYPPGSIVLVFSTLRDDSKTELTPDLLGLIV